MKNCIGKYQEISLNKRRRNISYSIGAYKQLELP